MTHIRYEDGHAKSRDSDLTDKTLKSFSYTKNYYEPGGTMTVIRDNVTGRVYMPINDKSWLDRCARWSFYKLMDSNGSYINVVTVLRPTKSEDMYTNYQQQVSALKMHVT
jgi:hypothetical protein